MRVTRLGENRSSGFFLDRKTDRQQIRGRWRLASFQRRVFHLSTILRYDTSSSYFERFHFHRLPRSVLAPINFPELWSRIFDQLISTLCQSSKKIYFLLHISIPLPFEDTERSLILSALSACCMPMMIIVTQR